MLYGEECDPKNGLEEFSWVELAKFILAIIIVIGVIKFGLMK